MATMEAKNTIGITDTMKMGKTVTGTSDEDTPGMVAKESTKVIGEEWNPQ